MINVRAFILWLLCSVFVWLISCNKLILTEKDSDNTRNKNIKIKYYKDFDDIKLVGLNEITDKKLIYPYVEAHYLNDKVIKTIVHAEDSLFFAIDYTYEEECPKSVTNIVIPGVIPEVLVKYYLDSEVVVFEYTLYDPYVSIKDTILISLKVQKAYSSVKYFFSRNAKIFCKSSKDYKSLSLPISEKEIIEKGISVWTQELLPKDNFLEVKEEKRSSKKNPEVYYEKHECYDLLGYSVFWWKMFGLKFPKANCDNF